MSSDEIERMVQRAHPKALARALERGRLPRSVERSLRREDGHAAPTPREIELLAREAGVAPASTADMTSALVRRMVAMQTLNGTKGLARTADGDQNKNTAGAPEETSAEGGALDQWWASMAAQGMNKDEIEEHLISRMRALRGAYLGQAEARRLRRK